MLKVCHKNNRLITFLFKGDNNYTSINVRININSLRNLFTVNNEDSRKVAAGFFS